jgi:hypothetical protein
VLAGVVAVSCLPLAVIDEGLCGSGMDLVVDLWKGKNEEEPVEKPEVPPFQLMTKPHVIPPDELRWDCCDGLFNGEFCTACEM